MLVFLCNRRTVVNIGVATCSHSLAGQPHIDHRRRGHRGHTGNTKNITIIHMKLEFT